MQIQVLKASTRFWVLLLVILTSVPQFSFGQTKARQLVNEMIRGMSRVQTMTGKIRRLERMDGEMVPGEMRFKFMMDPRKAYIYNIVPDEGAEVLYVKGWNNDKAYVHPNKFPWVNVSFSLYSSVMLKGHHSMNDLGFDYTLRIIKHLLKTRGEEFDQYVEYKGKKTWYGKSVDVIEINYGDKYGTDEYVVQANEDLFKIDEKLCVPAYRIVELNDDIDDFFDVKAGQKITVPNVYAKRVIFMIDEKDKLPIVQVVYDDKGMFSKYEYFDFKVNPTFQSTEFRTDFPEYNF